MTKLELAEAYYAVARDLEDNGRRQLEMAQQLAKHGDALCEENMRETPTPEEQPK